MLKLKNPFRRREKLIHPAWKIAGTLLVLFLAAYFFGKPIYRGFRSWRTSANADKAVEAFDSGNFPEARRLAMSVLQLQKERYDMLKITQRSMAELNDPRAIQLAVGLMRHPESTAEDQLTGFTVVCQEMPIATASLIRLALGPEKANSPEYLLPFLARLIDQNLQSEAASLLSARNDVDLQPALRLQAIRLMLLDPDPARLERAQFDISDLVFSASDLALDAFRLIADIPPEQFRSSYFPDLDQWIATQEEATTADHLAALIQPLHRYPERNDQIVQDAIDRYADAEPLTVANWLLNLKRPEQALELLPAEESALDRDRFRSRALALIASERWQEASEWLATPPEQFPSIDLSCLRIKIADHLEGSSTREWNYALKEAQAESAGNAFLELHQRMLDDGHPELAKEAMAEAVALGRGRLPLWKQVRHLVPWLREEGKTQTLLGFCTVMCRLEALNPEVKVEALDIGCILGKVRATKAIEELQSLRADIPSVADQQRFREALGTAQIIDNQPTEALATLASGSPESNEAPDPRQRVAAIRAIAAVMQGNPEPPELEKIDWKSMLREERELFQKLLTRAEEELAAKSEAEEE